MFKVFTVDELIEYCKKYNWTRQIKEFHLHHTWAPTHKNFYDLKGDYQKIQMGMYNYHVKNLGWQDIGQNLSLAPDGMFILGRDFNKNPGSITNRNIGAFAIEMIGNFDIGKDKLEGKQLEAILKFLKFFVEFKLKNDYSLIKFHNEFSPKTCPGSSVIKKDFIEKVKNYNNETTIDDALNFFIESGVINSPDYWVEQTKNVKYLDVLLIKLADYCNKK